MEQLAEGGGGAGRDFLALGWLLGVGRLAGVITEAGAGWDGDNEVSAETAGILCSTEKPTQPLLGTGPVGWSHALKAAWTFDFGPVGGS